MHRDRSDDETTAAYYEAHARDYAQETAHLSMAPQIARFTASLPRGARILDLGCGAGRDLRQFRLLGFAPVGLDRSVGLASIAAKYALAPTVVGDMRSLPFKSGAFEGIWASASLLHLDHEGITNALKECRRVLSPAAPFFSSVKLGRGQARDGRGRFFSYFSAGQWRDLLASHRFEVLAIDTDRDQDQRARDGHPDTGWISAYSRAT